MVIELADVLIPDWVKVEKPTENFLLYSLYFIVYALVIPGNTSKNTVSPTPSPWAVVAVAVTTTFSKIPVSSVTWVVNEWVTPVPTLWN